MTKIMSNILKIFTTGIFIWFLIHFSNNNVYINYDSIPYTASSYLLKNNQKDEAYQYSWELVKTKVSPAIFQNLCCSSDYRKSMSGNMDAFYSHLPAYSTKSGYIYLIRLVSDILKVDEVDAMKIITNASIVLIVIMASLYFFNRSFFIHFAVFPILLISQILVIGRLLTPDALIALIILASSFLLVSNKIIAGNLLMAFSILLRQINIIFFCMTCLIFIKRKQLGKFFMMIMTGLILYFLNSLYFESLGYWKHFYSNLIYLPSTFVNFSPEFSINIFLDLLKTKFLWMVAHSELNRFIGIVLFNTVIASYALTRRLKDIYNEILIGACLSYGIVFAYILFPVPDHRLYSGVVIASSLMLLSGFARRFD